MNLRLIRFSVAIVLAMPWQVVRADGGDSAGLEQLVQLFSFSAFGTLGAVHSSLSEADFVASVLQDNGAGYPHSWSTEVDTRLGAQLMVNVAPKLAAVLQVIAEQNYDGSFTPHVQWANIKYQFTPDLSLRVGRSVLPTFLYSDTLKVGYTYPWVRPPIEVYALLPTTVIDGLDLSYRLHMGDFDNTLELNVGQANGEQPRGVGATYGRNSVGFSDLSEYEFFSLRLSYQRTSLTVAGIDPFLDAFRQFGPQGIAIADQYESDPKQVQTELVGASYDPGHWFATGEWGHSNAHSFIGDNTAWYLSGGYHIRQFAPFVTYARSSAAGGYDTGLNLTGVPAAEAGFAAGLNAGLKAVLASQAVQKTVSLGVRWDFHKNLDLKLQADHTRLGADSSGTLVNVQPGFRPGSTVNLFSAAVDFVL
jgi:hypothetical protein